MSTSDQLFLVTGATGRQGGSVARRLLQSGRAVRALTRDPHQPAAQALAALGAEVVAGDMDQPDTLPPALNGVYGVFGVQNFWEAGFEREVAQGQALVDAARAAGVQHFIYTSVGGAERNSGLAHFESKWLIEKHLYASGLTWTVFRPVFFMDNLLANRKEISEGTMAFGLPPEVPLQMIAVDDIGAFVELAFADPGTWAGQAVELAGDELTGPQAAALFSEVQGREVQYVAVPVDAIAAENPEWALMLQWFIDHGYEADITALRELYPPLQDFRAWLRAVGWQ